VVDVIFHLYQPQYGRGREVLRAGGRDRGVSVPGNQAVAVLRPIVS